MTLATEMKNLTAQATDEQIARGESIASIAKAKAQEHGTTRFSNLDVDVMALEDAVANNPKPDEKIAHSIFREIAFG